MTPEMEKDIRDWLALQDSLYAKGGVWHGRKQEAHHIRLAAAVTEIDRLRQRVTNLEDIESDDQEEIDRLRAELTIVEEENKEVRAGAERECDRLRGALKPLLNEVKYCTCAIRLFDDVEDGKHHPECAAAIARAVLEG